MSSGAETRLQTIRRALLAFRQTPGRRGRLVHLQQIDELLVGGDMHGNVENFRRLMQRADLAHRPRRHLVLQELVHGPFRYPTGGDKSHQLLDLVCALKCQYPRQVHFLIGNHELAQAAGRRFSRTTTTSTTCSSKASARLRKPGGRGLCPLPRADRGGPARAAHAWKGFVSHSLPVRGDAAGVRPRRAGVRATRPADLAAGGSVYSLVWGRDVREETVAGFLRKVDADVLISGHIPCEAGFARPSPRHVIVDSQGSPAGYCLVPADRPISPAELEGCVHLL